MLTFNLPEENTLHYIYLADNNANVFHQGLSSVQTHFVPKKKMLLEVNCEISPVFYCNYLDGHNCFQCRTNVEAGKTKF